MNTKDKQVNGRTFREIAEGLLNEIASELSADIGKKLQKAELVRDKSASMARDYECQADGLIDAAATIQNRLNDCKRGRF